MKTKNNKKVNNKNNRIFRGPMGAMVLTFGLVACIAFCISGTVISQNKGADQVDQAHFRQLEKEYVGQVKSVLEENGYQNSGVTMTKVMEESGEREYTVVIHNQAINKLGTSEQENLLKQLENIGFPIDSCFFYHEFLVTEA